MLGRKKEEPDTFLEQGAAFEGNLKFRGTLRIDGDFTGDILQGSTVIVGEKADIHGNIHVASVIFSGEIHGDIEADEKVEVRSSARVFGNIRAPNVVIDEKAVVVGTCEAQQPEGAHAIATSENDKAPLATDLQAQGMTESSDIPIPEGTIAAMAPADAPSDKDNTLAFLEDCCTVSPDSHVQAKPFYEAYRKWCESKRREPLSMVQFGRIMTKKYQKTMISGRYFYQGIYLVKESENSAVPAVRKQVFIT